MSTSASARPRPARGAAPRRRSARHRTRRRGLLVARATSLAAPPAGVRPSPWTRRISSRRRWPPGWSKPTTATSSYFVGGGVAAFDCDDDGRPDLYLAGAHSRRRCTATSRPAARSGSPIRRRGDRPAGRHRRLPARHRRRPSVDLAVLRQGEDVVLRGLGDCRFERANERARLRRRRGWTVAFSATWEGPDAALPTLAFGDYLDLDATGNGPRRARRPPRPARGVTARPTLRRSR